MNSTNNPVIAWINPINVSDVAKFLLTSKKMIADTSNQHMINNLLSVLRIELHSYKYGSPNEKIFLFKIDLLEQHLISLMSCVKEIVPLLKPEIQQQLQSSVSSL